jgi:hypothetical protein
MEEDHDQQSTIATTTTTKKKLTKRIRAHSNPFTPPEEGAVPLTPSLVEWGSVFKGWKTDARVEIADIGCGFGGLMYGLAPLVNLYPFHFRNRGGVLTLI